MKTDLEFYLSILTDGEKEQLMDLVEGKKKQTQSDDFPGQWQNERIDELLEDIQGTR